MPERSWKVEFFGNSLKHLEKLPRSESRRVLDKLERLESSDHPAFHRDVRPLAGQLKGFYRLRVGDLRVIFEIDGEGRRIGVLAVLPRGRAY